MHLPILLTFAYNNIQLLIAINEGLILLGLIAQHLQSDAVFGITLLEVGITILDGGIFGKMYLTISLHVIITKINR